MAENTALLDDTDLNTIHLYCHIDKHRKIILKYSIYYLVKVTELNKDGKPLERSFKQTEDCYDFELFCKRCKHWNFYKRKEVNIYGSVFCKYCGTTRLACPICDRNPSYCYDLISGKPCSLQNNQFYNAEIQNLGDEFN